MRPGDADFPPFRWEPSYTAEDMLAQDRDLLRLETDGPAWLRSMYSPIETQFSGESPLLWAKNHYWVAHLAVVAYLLFIWIGPKYMARRKAFSLRLPLRYWNLLLAVFSFIGMMRAVPHLFELWRRYGLGCIFCGAPIFTVGRGSSGLWMMLFVYSKYFELVDTAFIVFRKRPLTFLHWYHHSTVLLYSWDAYVEWQAPAMCFCAMNYTVHAIMYFYYYLASTMKSPPRWSMLVTVLQILQMFIGMGITGYGLYLAHSYPFMAVSDAESSKDPIGIKGECFIRKKNLYFALAMYASYFYLFADFFLARYFKRTALIWRTSTPHVSKKAL